MRDRPVFVWIICWYLIVTSCLGLIFSFSALEGMEKIMRVNGLPFSVPVQLTLWYSSMAVPLITAILMHEGHNWGRIVYLVWGIGYYLLMLVITFPDTWNLQPGVAIFAGIGALLMLPRATEYFCLPRHFS